MSCPDPILATVLNSDLCLPQTESHPYKWKKWPMFGKFIVIHLPKMIWWTLLENDWYEGYILCIFSPRDPCLLIICSTWCLLPPAWATTKLSRETNRRNTWDSDKFKLSWEWWQETLWTLVILPHCHTTTSWLMLLRGRIFLKWLFYE